MKTRITVCLLILATVISMPLNAQDGNDVKSSKRVSYSGTSEIDIAVGLPNPMNGYGYLLGRNIFTFFDDRGLYSTGDISSLPSFHLEYGYNLLDWLSIGGAIGYAHYEFPLHSLETDRYACTETMDRVDITVNARFYWLNRKWVRMYSGVGVGLSILDFSSSVDKEDGTISALSLGFDLTYLGLTVGKSFYGRFELGAGSVNMLSAGIGYRF